MDAKCFKDARGLTNLTLKQPISRYTGEIDPQEHVGSTMGSLIATSKRNNGLVSTPKTGGMHAFPLHKAAYPVEACNVRSHGDAVREDAG